MRKLAEIAQDYSGRILKGHGELYCLVSTRGVVSSAVHKLHEATSNRRRVARGELGFSVVEGFTFLVVLDFGAQGSG